MLRLSALVLVLASLFLVACSGGGQSGSSSSSSGDVAAGKTVFESKGCGTCHTLSGAAGAVGTTGPNLNGIGSRAANQKPGTSAEAYIRESEQNPNAFVVQGFQPNVMIAFTGTPQELDNLVAFLLAQR
jgi:cytochrome c2